MRLSDFWTCTETIYESLWDTGNKNYMKKNAREQSNKSLMNELIKADFEIHDEEALKKKIKKLQGCI